MSDFTDHVIAALPPPDVKLDTACPPVKYLHRVLKDGNVYFFFNESGETQTCNAMLAGTGSAQVWDAATGTIHLLEGVTHMAESVNVPLSLAAYESRFIVVNR